MIAINISDKQKEKFDKLLRLYHGRHDELIEAMLTFKRQDLKKGIRNLERELKFYEEKYGISSVDFIADFSSGKYGDDNDDFIIWSGIYETL